MATFLTALAELAGIGLLVNTVISFAIKLIMAIVSTIYFLAATIILQAMCELDISVIDGWFDSAVGSNFTNTITGVGLFICLILTLWEMLKYIWTFVTGENPQSRPGAIAVKLLTYGAWTTVAIPTSKVLFTAFHEIYKAVKTMLFGGESVLVALGNFYSSGNSLTADSFTSSISDVEKENEGLSLFLSALDVIDAIPVILGTFLLVICMFQFLKLLLSAFSKFSSIIIYIYLSPLATGCGVSQSLMGITWSWFKNFVSSLICWILNLWMIYSTLCLFKAFPSGGGVQFFCWTGVTLGWVRCGQNLDSILKDVGLTVTHSSGSVMRDMVEMGYAWRPTKGFMGTASKIATGAKIGLTNGIGLGGLNDIVSGGAESAKRFGASDNNGAPRSMGQKLKDMFVCASVAAGRGQFSVPIKDGLSTMFGSVIDSGKYAIEKATGIDLKSNRAKENAALKADNATSKYLDRGANLVGARQKGTLREGLAPQGIEFAGKQVKRNGNQIADNGETEQACRERNVQCLKGIGLSDDEIEKAMPQINELQKEFGKMPVSEFESKCQGVIDGTFRESAEKNGADLNNISDVAMMERAQKNLDKVRDDLTVTGINKTGDGATVYEAVDKYGNMSTWMETAKGGTDKQLVGKDKKSGSSGISIGSPTESEPQVDMEIVNGTIVDKDKYNKNVSTATYFENGSPVRQTKTEDTGKEYAEGHIYRTSTMDCETGEKTANTVIGTKNSSCVGISSEMARDVSPEYAENRATRNKVDSNGKKTGGKEFVLTKTK